jgi:hypothetical protein
MRLVFEVEIFWQSVRRAKRSGSVAESRAIAVGLGHLRIHNTANRRA